MRPEIDIFFDRQAVSPGEFVEGKLVIENLQENDKVVVSFQGEETLGANNIVRSYVLPILEEQRIFETTTGTNEFEFKFPVPTDAPPTYGSRDIRCHYHVKVHVKRSWFRDLIRRYNVAVTPKKVEPPSAVPTELQLTDGPVRCITRLNTTSLFTGESLAGSLLVESDHENAPLPTKLTFRFAAIEESLERGYRHREVVWLETHDVEPDEEMVLPISGLFEFPIDRQGPFSGNWNTFKVHYGFRVGMYLPGGRHVRESLPIRVTKHYGDRSSETEL